MLFILGILTGIGLSMISVLASILFMARYKPALERTIKQTESRFKKKGSILEPESEELSNWVRDLPQE